VLGAASTTTLADVSTAIYAPGISNDYSMLMRVVLDVEQTGLYEFQVVNGDLMRWMPCFCGCHRSDGHRNNRDCYVEAVNPDGSCPTVIFGSRRAAGAQGPGLYEPSWQPGPGREAGPIVC